MLALEGAGLVTANRAADARIEPNDGLICFGKTDMVRRELGGIAEPPATSV